MIGQRARGSHAKRNHGVSFVELTNLTLYAGQPFARVRFSLPGL